MNFKNVLLVLFLIAFQYPRIEGGVDAFVAEATEVIAVVRIGVSLVEYIHQVFSDIFKDSGGVNIDPTGGENNKLNREILFQYQIISDALYRLGKNSENVEKAVEKLQKTLPAIVREELRLDRVDAIVRSVGNAYSTFEYYQEHKSQIEAHTLLDFSETTTSHGEGSIRHQLEDLHALIVPAGGFTGGQGVLHLLMNRFDNTEPICSMEQSPHQLMYSLYNVIALTEIKGFAMMQFSYMMLRLYDKGNFTLESDLVRRQFEQQATEKLLAVKEILPKMSRKFWKCDPDRHIEGRTFEQLTQLLQGVIENEIDMNPTQNCKANCNDIKVADAQSCYKNLFCAKQRRCDGGRLYDCRFYDADAWVCMSENSDERRYDYIEYEDGTLLGDKYANGPTCRNKIKVDSWWRWLFWHCSYCLCKCDAQGPNSDRYWSLKEAKADTSSNKVVTGVRFVKKNRIVHLEIQEAEALPEGTVKEETRSWKAAESLDVNTAKEGEDYFTMTYATRALDLDSLEAQPGHVITGVRLRDLGGHLNLEVEVTPISFSDGRLATENSAWTGNDITPVTSPPRTELLIVNPDVSSKTSAPSRMLGVDGKFVQFDSTSPEKDVMQTTIPFIDVQEVTPKSGSWLSGVGLYYKGNPGYGGFVGLSVSTFDFSRHLLPDQKSGRSQQLKYDFSRLKAQRLRKEDTADSVRVIIKK